MLSLSSTNQPESLSLLTMFSQFYQRIAKIKEALDPRRPAIDLATLMGRKTAINDADQATVISDDLHSMLRIQYEKIQKNGSAIDIEAYKQCQYIMASLADELFLLKIKWHGQDQWLAVMLEQRIFGTTSAGISLFKRIDKLINNKIQSNTNSQLAAVYLLALRLGFCGKYQNKENATLATYRNHLFRMTGNTRDFSDEQKLFSDAYEHRLNPLEQVHLAPLSKWHRIMLAAIAAYLALTLAAWNYAVYTLYF